MKKAGVTSIFVAVVLLALGVIAEAQHLKKVFRIGYLSTTDPSRESARSEAIRLGLRERGYIEGQTIAFEYRYAEGKLDLLPALAAELVALKVDIIVVAGGAIVIRPVMNATKTIPIVMLTGGDDPVEAGLVESLARPGGNVTGITNLSRELGGKRLELLKEAVPKGRLEREEKNEAKNHGRSSVRPSAKLRAGSETRSVNEGLSVESQILVLSDPAHEKLFWRPLRFCASHRKRSWTVGSVNS